jgi:hypothetical protein
MVPLLPAVAIGAALVIPVAEQVPTLNIKPGCRAAATALGINQDVEACMRSENNARNELSKVWAQFPAADRTSCMSLIKIGSNGTHTDLLTCLEIKRDARLLPKEPGIPTTGQGRR